jgi:hypothetical protein
MKRAVDRQQRGRPAERALDQHPHLLEAGVAALDQRQHRRGIERQRALLAFGFGLQVDHLAVVEHGNQGRLSAGASVQVARRMPILPASGGTASAGCCGLPGRGRCSGCLPTGCPRRRMRWLSAGCDGLNP